MTAAIHHFPVPAAWMAQREAEARRIETIAAAREIIRGAAWQDDASLTLACETIQDHGDPTDHLQADALLLAIRLRARRRAQDAAKAAALASTRKGTIRRALVDCAGLAVILAVACAVYMAAP
jgi:hypothetical protein